MLAIIMRRKKEKEKKKEKQKEKKKEKKERERKKIYWIPDNNELSVNGNAEVGRSLNPQ